MDCLEVTGENRPDEPTDKIGVYREKDKPSNLHDLMNPSPEVGRLLDLLQAGGFPKVN
jgi:hypothetical protein